jgi:hypothetical protein
MVNKLKMWWQRRKLPKCPLCMERQANMLTHMGLHYPEILKESEEYQRGFAVGICLCFDNWTVPGLV